MMIPGDYQARKRAPSLAPGEALEVRYAHPAVSSGAGNSGRATLAREWPVWVRLVVPLAVLFLVMFAATWITSLTR